MSYANNDKVLIMDVDTKISDVKSVTDLLPDAGALSTIDANVVTTKDANIFAEKVYPTLADGVSCAKNNAKWVLGNLAQVVPANTIAGDFYITGIQVENATVVGKWELVLYYGDSNIECARVRAWVISAVGMVPSIKHKTPVIPANSKISIALAQDTVGAGTVTVSLRYRLK